MASCRKGLGDQLAVRLGAVGGSELAGDHDLRVRQAQSPLVLHVVEDGHAVGSAEINQLAGFGKSEAARLPSHLTVTGSARNRAPRPAPAGRPARPGRAAPPWARDRAQIEPARIPAPAVDGARRRRAGRRPLPRARGVGRQGFRSPRLGGQRGRGVSRSGSLLSPKGGRDAHFLCYCPDGVLSAAVVLYTLSTPGWLNELPR